MTEQTIPKPIPEPDEASRPFFEGAREGKLRLMRCTNCGAPRLPSRQHCDRCLSDGYEWFQASGAGKLHTFGIMHQRYHPAFVPDLPYNIAVVELEEGPHIVTNIVGASNASLRVGMPVEVEFEQHDDVGIPKFRPA